VLDLKLLSLPLTINAKPLKPEYNNYLNFVLAFKLNLVMFLLNFHNVKVDVLN
jgi:hypothetical protein